MGFVGGIAAGALIGEATNEPSAETLGFNTLAGGMQGAAIGGVAGLVLGLVIGEALSQSDQVIAPNSYGDAHRALQQLARYPDAEPDYLKEIP